MDSQIWITEKEVARLTGISISTLQKQRFYRKGISYSKVGRSVRYALKDVESYMDSHLVDITRVQ